MALRGFVVGDRILGQSADSHSDWCAAYGQLGAYRFVGASAIGKLHRRDVRPRDDAFVVRSAGVWLAVAVSDGVGSRPLSRYGASFAAEALCEHLLREVTAGPPPPEREPGIPGSAADEEGPPTPGEPEVPGTKRSEVAKGFWPRLFGRIPAEPTAGVGTIPPGPFLDAPLPFPPSEEAAIPWGTLMWREQFLVNLPHGNSDSAQPQSSETEVAPFDLSPRVRCAFQRTRHALEQFALSRGATLREFHATLLGLLLNTETGEAAAGHIGDGLVAVFHPGLGAQPLVDAPTPSEVGETYVFTQDDWENYLAVRALSSQETQGITTFYLMTDGVAEDCTHPPPEDVFQRWARDIDREVRQDNPLVQTATRLLRWLTTYEVKGSWDDRTLVVVLRDF